MMNTTTNRRAFLKKIAKISAITAATAMFPGLIFAEEQLLGLPNDQDLSWDKAPCRFCGVGCGLLIGTKDGKAIGSKTALTQPNLAPQNRRRYASRML